MVIRINGKEEAMDRPKNLAELICGKGLVPEHVVVEHNFRIAPADEWSGITLGENDNIEIISFVGGG
jgi:thiamine biosynthesis protein ThiS